MPDPRLSLPIVPSSPSLHAHLAALDILSLRLSTLTSSTSHPTRIPLTSKASLNASIVHTNDIKVHLGGEWWVDMTASEAADYVRRRKEALLEDHARLAEGRGRPPASDRLEIGAQLGESSSNPITSPRVGFHPLLYTPRIVETPTTPREEVETVLPVPKAEEAEKSPRKSTATTPEVKQSEVKPVPASAQSQESTEPSKSASLVELLADQEEDEAEQTPGPGDDTTLNEEGLPFHEIRETLDGETIGAPPPPTTSGGDFPTADKEKDDYFSSEAVARREALRRKLFNEDTDSEDDISGPSVPPSQPIRAKGGVIRASTSETANPASPQTTLPTQSDDQDTPSPTSPRPIIRRSSSSAPPPSRSILKPSSQKKSVTFDPSIPAPPESPQKPAIQPNRFGFPLPLATIEPDDDEYAPKPVPVIATPIPTKKNVEEKGFAGFKRGFLAGPPKVGTTQEDQAGRSSSPTMKSPADGVKSVVAEKPTTSKVGNASSSSSSATPAPAPRKPSLFAQRLAQPEIDASAPEIGTTSSLRTPALPRASESKSTSTVKPSVIEKQPTKPVHIVERNPPAPRVSASTANSGTSTSRAGHEDKEVEDENGGPDDHDHDEDSDSDEIDEYSDEEEDEYDLDDALLAREVALEYHRRQAYQPLNRDPDDIDEEEVGAEGGVMLGLPRIADLDPEGHGPLIINPTPDDLRRFVRVGRLENGNLVLAPGEDGPSDSEAEAEAGEGEGEDEVEGDEEKQRLQRKKNREQIRRKLMGLEVPSSTADKGRKNKEKQDEAWKRSLPPSLAPETASASLSASEAATAPPPPTDSAVSEKKPVSSFVTEAAPAPARRPLPPTAPAALSGTIPSPGADAAQPKPKEKKVSRFKAARMGQ